MMLDFQEHQVSYVRGVSLDALPSTSGSSGGNESLRSCVILGDALANLRDLPNASAQMVITSPPYWGLRDYAMADQVGLEDDPEAYIESLVTVFDEVWRVLRDDGTLWLNIGDSYTSGGRTWRAPDKKHPVRAMSVRPPTPQGLKPKELVGIPWKLAFALQARGWYLRADMIWRKPNAMPESVKDRPARAHEYLFLLSKSERYVYNHGTVKEAGSANIRSVWDINTQPLRDVHFATFPAELVTRCMLLGSNPGDTVLDPFIGSGTVGVVAIDNGRSFIGIELNPAYIEVIKRRINGVGLRLDRHLEEVSLIND